MMLPLSGLLAYQVPSLFFSQPSLLDYDTLPQHSRLLVFLYQKDKYFYMGQNTSFLQTSSDQFVGHYNLGPKYSYLVITLLSTSKDLMNFLEPSFLLYVALRYYRNLQCNHLLANMSYFSL